MNEQEELERQANELQSQTQRRIDQLEEFVKESAKRTNFIMNEDEDDGMDHIDLDNGLEAAEEQPEEEQNPYKVDQNPFVADTKLRDLDRELERIREEDSTQQQVQSILEKVKSRQKATAQAVKP